MTMINVKSLASQLASLNKTLNTQMHIITLASCSDALIWTVWKQIKQKLIEYININARSSLNC